MVEMSSLSPVVMGAQWYMFIKTQTSPLKWVHLLYVNYFPIKLFKTIVLFYNKFSSAVCQLINLSGIIEFIRSPF